MRSIERCRITRNRQTQITFSDFFCFVWVFFFCSYTQGNKTEKMTISPISLCFSNFLAWDVHRSHRKLAKCFNIISDIYWVPVSSERSWFFQLSVQLSSMKQVSLGSFIQRHLREKGLPYQVSTWVEFLCMSFSILMQKAQFEITFLTRGL